MSKNLKKDNNLFGLEHPTFRTPKTLGERAADNLTKWAGSWVFIFIFAIFLAIWIGVNSLWVIFGKTWDPYPFIFLNLALSCLAAIQAPIILISHNKEKPKNNIKKQY